MATKSSYTIADLARVAGTNVRTIRYWIAQGLIPASGESGPGAHYGEGHLDRLRLIKRLQAEFLPNAEIRRRLAPLSDAEIASVVAVEPNAEPPRPTTSALDYVRGLLGGSTPQQGKPMRASAAPPPPAPKSMPVAEYPTARPAGYSPMSIVSPRAESSEPAAIAGAIPDLAAELSAEPAQPAPTPPEAAAKESPPERSQWERLSLGPNIELHVRRPLSRLEQRRVERLITIARQVLTEDQS